MNGIDAAALFAIAGNQINYNLGSLFDALAVGENATVVVGYTVKDTLDAASSSTLTLTVTGANDAPTAVVDTGSIGENGAPVSFNVVANDVDPDVNDTLTLLSLGTVTVTSLNGDVNGIDASTAFSIASGRIAFNPGTLFDHLDHDDTRRSWSTTR